MNRLPLQLLFGQKASDPSQRHSRLDERQNEIWNPSDWFLHDSKGSKRSEDVPCRHQLVNSRLCQQLLGSSGSRPLDVCTAFLNLKY